MRHSLDVHDDATAVATAAAEHVVARAARAVADHGSFHFAVSGGHTPWAMFAVLAERDMPWEQSVIYQVDERMAPADDPDRNLAHLHEALAGAPAAVVAMPVEAPDPDAAAASYAAELPDRFDLVHLGLGPDGHTASLVPGDAVLDVTDRLVAPTAGEYQGRRRMTLTYPGLARAERLLWLVTGDTKVDPLRALLSGDTSIPAGRVEAGESLIMADRAAAPAT
ncbi:MAG: 6-phosphogluconolactonase [Actinomycetia bacterium]|nr:6-phosphogluconolactonase [Actinomycetes bacterium]